MHDSEAPLIAIRWRALFASREFISTAIYKIDKVGATVVSLCASRCCRNKGDADELRARRSRIHPVRSDHVPRGRRASRRGSSEALQASKRMQAVRPKVAEQ